VTRVVGGLDGCPGGWVLATVPVDDRASQGFAVSVLTSLAPVVAALTSGRMVCAAIDIPIGLAPREPRDCDLAARRLLGPRRSSVFPAPARGVLGARSYEDACARSRRACGKGISRQLYNILDKIRVVDELQSPRLQPQLFEMSPELSFMALTGAPMPANKRAPAGRAAREQALRSAFGDRGAPGAPPAGAKRDDVLDALVGAWTARRFVAGAHLHLGGQLDERGLRMEITA
jgi:predicted RNase H-like nuclease